MCNPFVRSAPKPATMTHPNIGDQRTTPTDRFRLHLCFTKSPDEANTVSRGMNGYKFQEKTPQSTPKKATSLLISESTLAGGTIGSDGGVGVAKGCPTLYNLGHENCETSKVACREIERGNRRAIHRGHHTTTRRVGDRQAVFASFEKATLRNRPNCSIAAPMLVGKFLINSVLSCRLLLIDQYGLRLMDEGQYSQGIVQDTIRRAVQKSACGKER